MKTNEKLNLTMLCDFYELTMGNGYFAEEDVKIADLVRLDRKSVV